MFTFKNLCTFCLRFQATEDKETEKKKRKKFCLIESKKASKTENDRNKEGEKKKDKEEQ